MTHQSNKNSESYVEKRTFKRIYVNINARFFHGDLFYSGIVRNLCNNGMFINTKKCLPHNSMFVVILRDEDCLLKVVAKVNRVSITSDIYSGMGLELIKPFSGYLDFVHGLCVPSSRNLS